MTLRSSLQPRVTVVEVGPRDGLQNETRSVGVEQKTALVERLAAAGLPIVEAGAFVHPRAVPQMADSHAIFRALPRGAATRYVALVPNLTGYQRARAAGAAEVAVFTAASETFSQRNTSCSVEESFTRLAEVFHTAAQDRVPVRAYLSTAWWCPYEGRIAPEVVAALTTRLLDLGAWQVSLGDTIGAAVPTEIEEVLDLLLLGTTPEKLALHCHDTRGTALANVLVGLERGLTTFDASAGGLGGCPYAPGAAGNLATEDLVYLLDGMGIESGVSVDAVARAVAPLEDILGHALPGRTFQAWRGSQDRS